MLCDTGVQTVGAILLLFDARDRPAQYQNGLRYLRDDQQRLALFNTIGEPHAEVIGAQVINDGAHAEALLAGRHVECHRRKRAANAGHTAALS